MTEKIKTLENEAEKKTKEITDVYEETGTTKALMVQQEDDIKLLVDRVNKLERESDLVEA